MLKNLLKYEMKATARLFIPLYAALLIFALINRIIKPLNLLESSTNMNAQVVLGFISLTVYFALIVGIVAMTIIIMIQRFYKNLLGDEGYLMFTLPTKSWKHILCKLIAAVSWTVFSFLTTIASLLIINGVENLQEGFLEMSNVIREYFGIMGFLLLIVCFIIYISANILMIYTAITLGHQFAKHKFMASFAMYCVLYTINQVLIGTLFLVGSMLFNTIFDSALLAPTPTNINIALSVMAFFAVLLGTGYFMATNVLLKKRLNLE